MFIIIPGLELLLPAWIAIFPNSVPTQFMSEDKKRAKLEETIQKRDRAAERLLYMVPKHLQKLAQDPLIPEPEREQILELREKMLTSRMLPEEMLKSRLLFQRYFDFKHFDIDMLLKVAYIFGMTPMTGITTINNLA